MSAFDPKRKSVIHVGVVAGHGKRWKWTSRSSWSRAEGAADRGENREAGQIAAIDSSDLAIMAHHPILDHNDTAGSLDHPPTPRVS